MKQYALDLWGRAIETLRVARGLVGYSDDNAASRAYYAAFYAVSALFAMEERTFNKHSAVEAAVIVIWSRAGVGCKGWAKILPVWRSCASEATMAAAGTFSAKRQRSRSNAQHALWNK